LGCPLCHRKSEMWVERDGKLEVGQGHGCMLGMTRSSVCVVAEYEAVLDQVSWRAHEWATTFC